MTAYLDKWLSPCEEADVQEFIYSLPDDDMRSQLERMMRQKNQSLIPKPIGHKASEKIQLLEKKHAEQLRYIKQLESDLKQSKEENRVLVGVMTEMVRPQDNNVFGFLKRFFR